MPIYFIMKIRNSFNRSSKCAPPKEKLDLNFYCKNSISSS